MLKRTRESVDSDSDEQVERNQGVSKYQLIDDDDHNDIGQPVDNGDKSLDNDLAILSNPQVTECVECHNIFSNEYMLNLHITEFHDPITDIKRHRGEKTFVCLVEDCEKICLTWQKRKRHCIDAHDFPENYDFFIIRHGIAGRHTLLRQKINADNRHGHMRKTDKMMNDAETRCDRDAILSSAMDDLKLVPAKISFGRPRYKTGLINT